jgi:hypothetical protein
MELTDGTQRSVVVKLNARIGYNLVTQSKTQVPDPPASPILTPSSSVPSKSLLPHLGITTLPSL